MILFSFHELRQHNVSQCYRVRKDDKDGDVMALNDVSVSCTLKITWTAP